MLTTLTSPSKTYFAICIHGRPVPQSRIRFARGRAYEPAPVKNYKRFIRDMAQYEYAKELRSGELPLKCAVRAEITIWRRYKETSKSFGDADNHAKSVLDALNGVFYVDDSQVVELTVNKVQSTREGVSAVVEALSE